MADPTRVAHLTASLGGKMRDPGNQLGRGGKLGVGKRQFYFACDFFFFHTQNKEGGSGRVPPLDLLLNNYTVANTINGT